MQRRTWPWAAAVLLSAFGASAQTIDVEGQKFDESLDLAGQRLVLNGVGVRTKAFFKIYAMGLYVGKREADPAALIKQPGAKRVVMRMLRDLDGKDMGKTFTQAMEKNMRPEERLKTINGIFQYGKNFGEIKRLTTGDSVITDWVPGTGTVVQVNGRVVGQPIPEPEFYAALLRVWLGDEPVDDKLKAGLLKPPPARK